MAYTVGSAKDARKDPGFTEQDFLNRFEARKGEILAYKRKYGGDLEGAYQKVTGEPWPSGRSVKVHGDGRVEMTKDRTVKSVLGKYVAGPAAYGGAILATGGAASPLLLGLGGGAGAGVGVGETAATTGLASGAGLPGLTAAPTIAGAGTAAAGTAPLASSQIGTGFIPPVGGSPGGGMSAIDKLRQAWDYIGRGTRAADVAGRLATNVGAQRQGDRLMEANANERQDVLRQRAAQMLEDALMNRAGLDLQRRQFALNAPRQRAGSSVQGDILANAQDASVQGPIVGTGGQMPTITGGLRPSLLSGNSRALGGQMSRQALLSQLKGDDFTPMPAPSIPGVTPLPQAGRVDRVLNWIGGTGNTIGALDEAGLFGGNGPLAQSRRAPQLPLPPAFDDSFGDFSGAPSGFVDPRTYGGRRIPGAMY